MKRVWEKIVEGILTCSGFVTSITILLIVVFLFAEALGLFNKKVIEEGYVLAVNKANPVQELSAAQIKDVFDEEITNWKELGGPDAEVKVFRLEDITSYFSEEELGTKAMMPGLPATISPMHRGAFSYSARSLPVIQASSLLFPPNL